MTKVPDIFIVTCSHLNNAFGPFLGLETAVSAAKSLTDNTECVYLPVPLRIQGAQVRMVEPEKDSSVVPIKRGDGGYL